MPASIMWQNGAKISRMSPEKHWQPFWFHLSLHASLLVLQKVNIDLQPWSKVSDLMQFTASIKASDGRERETPCSKRRTHEDARVILILADVTAKAVSQWREESRKRNGAE